MFVFKTAMLLDRAKQTGMHAARIHSIHAAAGKYRVVILTWPFYWRHQVLNNAPVWYKCWETRINDCQSDLSVSQSVRSAGPYRCMIPSQRLLLRQSWVEFTFQNDNARTAHSTANQRSCP